MCFLKICASSLHSYTTHIQYYQCRISKCIYVQYIHCMRFVAHEIKMKVNDLLIILTHFCLMVYILSVRVDVIVAIHCVNIYLTYILLSLLFYFSFASHSISSAHTFSFILLDFLFHSAFLLFYFLSLRLLYYA